MAAEGLTGRLTAKAGPLPVWGWAVLLLVAFFAFQHFRSKSPAPAASSTDGSSTDSGAANPVPGFDAASEVGSGGSGFGTPPPTSIVNNYYGTDAAAQASGGGTSNGVTPRRVDPPIGTLPFPRLTPTAPARTTSPFVPNTDAATSTFVASGGKTRTGGGIR